MFHITYYLLYFVNLWDVITNENGEYQGTKKVTGSGKVCFRETYSDNCQVSK